MNHVTEEQLVAHHYGDITDRAEAAAVEEHLHACAECRAELDAICRTLAAVDALPVPERPDSYGAEVWARLQPAMAARRSHGLLSALAGLMAPGRLVLAGSVAELVVAAFVAGRFLPATRPASPAVSSRASSAAAPVDRQAAAQTQQVRERVLLVAVGEHLERSQIALIELVNNPEGPTVDLSEQRERARELVSENRLYRQTALTAGEKGMAEVLDELERELVEIANGPAMMTAGQFEKVRARIEQRGIIFKVRVFGDSVRQRELRPLDGTVHRG